MKPLVWLIGFILVWNIITFITMGIDKRRAEKDRQRISEKTLTIMIFAAGAIGITAGAYVFRHKTQKLKSKILMPLGIVVNAAYIYAFHLLGLF